MAEKQRRMGVPEGFSSLEEYNKFLASGERPFEWGDVQRYIDNAQAAIPLPRTVYLASGTCTVLACKTGARKLLGDEKSTFAKEYYGRKVQQS